MTKNKTLFITNFLKLEAAGGILLVLASILAIVLANSPLSSIYDLLLSIPVVVQVGTIKLAKPLLLWINDGLMAIFFFLIGLELKRELTTGILSDKKNVILPVMGAIGGMLLPALFYWLFNNDNPVAMQGWAIPAATDIAFALGALALLGKRVPQPLKTFLLSLAIFDDIGAIIIIALFYTSKISLLAVSIVALCILHLAFFNKKNITQRSPYIIVGIIMWVAMIKSGIHATLAGLILALFIPMYSNKNPKISPLKNWENDLHPTIVYFILPVFAFANTGVNFSDSGLEGLLHPVPLGIATGLFFGKQIGIFGICALGILLKIVPMPKGMTWSMLYGISALCGIGFTMSMFIGSLAFEETGVNLLFDERLGIILGSLASGILGYTILYYTLPKETTEK